jgi:hypothetical protein
MLLRIWTKFKVEVSQWNISLEPSLSQLWILKLNKNWVLNSLNKVESWKSTMQYVIKVHTQQLWIMKPSWWRSWKIDTSFFLLKLSTKVMNFSSYQNMSFFQWVTCIPIDVTIHVAGPSCETHLVLWCFHAMLSTMWVLMIKEAIYIILIYNSYNKLNNHTNNNS